LGWAFALLFTAPAVGWAQTNGSPPDDPSHAAPADAIGTLLPPPAQLGHAPDGHDPTGAFPPADGSPPAVGPPPLGDRALPLTPGQAASQGLSSFAGGAGPGLNVLSPYVGRVPYLASFRGSWYAAQP